MLKWIVEPPNWGKFNSEKPEEDGYDDEYPLRWQVLMALPHLTIHKLTSAVADFPALPKKKEPALVLHGSTTKLPMSLNPEKAEKEKWCCKQ